MRANEFIRELAFADGGKGATPRNTEVDHNGMRVLMTPEDYIRLAAPLPLTPAEEEKIKAMMQSGITFAQPWLTIEVPNEWREYKLPPEQRFAKPGRVSGHEGRHRMYAHLWQEGNQPVEVHIILHSPNKEWRNSNWVNDNKNDYSQAVADALNTGMKNESGTMLRGPFFHYEASEE